MFLAGCSQVMVRLVGHTVLETTAGKACSEAFQQAASRVQRPQLHDDMQVTTLQKLVAALGGEVEIVCKFPKGDVRLVQFDRMLAVAGQPQPISRIAPPSSAD